MRVLCWDIETTPLSAHSWSLWPKAISIDQIIDTQKMMCFSAKWVGEKKVFFYSTHHDGERAMLQAAWDLLNEADAVISWNGSDYDTKHVSREFFEAGIKPPAPYKEIDLMRAVKRRFRFASNKLDHVSRVLGLEGKHKVDFDLWLGCMAGDEKSWATMRRYNKRDVALLEQLYEHLLPWIPGHPNVALYNDSEQDQCPACSSENLRREGHAYTQVGRFQRYRCADCGKWSRSGKRSAGVDLRAVTS